jgi:hypothetical protein
MRKMLVVTALLVATPSWGKMRSPLSEADPVLTQRMWQCRYQYMMAVLTGLDSCPDWQLTSVGHESVTHLGAKRDAACTSFAQELVAMEHRRLHRAGWCNYWGNYWVDSRTTSDGPMVAPRR